MAKPFFQKPSSLTEWILFIIGTPLVLSSPYGARKLSRLIINQLENEIPEEDSSILKPGKVSQAIYRLKKRNIIDISEKDGKILIKLTEKGKKKTISDSIENLYIKNSSKWDGKWRMVMFDIPENKRLSRESLRIRLKQLGLLQFQKSIWIYPYECYQEIYFITDIFDISKYITILTATIDDDKPLRTYFNLH